MKKLQRSITRFFFNNRNRGIHNLMLYIGLGNLLVYVFSLADPSNVLTYALNFSREKIFDGQIWRLFSYIFIPDVGGNVFTQPLFLAIMFFFYFQIGRILESRWGVMKFNCYYLSGVIIMDIAALILNAPASAYYLNLSLILAFATMCPEDRVLILYVIPFKMKWLAWFYLGSLVLTFFTVPFPLNLFPIAALLNYFLFLGKEVRNVLPGLGTYRPSYTPPRRQNAAPNPQWSDRYRSKDGQKPYRHKCTVCGRTDTEYPDLEFRYCSRCKGYYCYCSDHINNHAHIQ